MVHERGDNRFRLQIVIAIVVVRFIAHCAIEAFRDPIGFVILSQPYELVLASTDSKTLDGDHLERGLQRQTLREDHPGSILSRLYSKGVRVIGHDRI